MGAAKTIGMLGNLVSVEIKGPVTYNITTQGRDSLSPTAGLAGQVVSNLLELLGNPLAIKGNQYGWLENTAGVKVADIQRGPLGNGSAKIRIVGEYDVDATTVNTETQLEVSVTGANDQFTYGGQNVPSGYLVLELSGNIPNQSLRGISYQTDGSPTTWLDMTIEGNGKAEIRLPFEFQQS